MIRNATDEQLESMWNQIIFMLGIKVAHKDFALHLDELAVLNGWVCQNYSDVLTREEVLLAYTMACTRKLPISELFSILNPKHVGIVLDAYVRFAHNDLEINRVFSQQLLLEAPKQTPEQINEFMESALLAAIEDVRTGKFYYDSGNGLFDWLLEMGRIEITEDEADDYYQKSVKALPKLLEREKTYMSAQENIKRGQLDNLLKLAEQGTYGEDHQIRIQAHAKRLFLNDHLKTLL